METTIGLRVYILVGFPDTLGEYPKSIVTPKGFGEWAEGYRGSLVRVYVALNPQP